MKQTHNFPTTDGEEVDRLVELLSLRDLLDKKGRINLYLSKAVIKLMDSLAQNDSRGALVSRLVIKEAKRRQKLPYGLFSGADISEKEIDQVTSEWEKTINELI